MSNSIRFCISYRTYLPHGRNTQTHIYLRQSEVLARISYLTAFKELGQIIEQSSMLASSLCWHVHKSSFPLPTWARRLAQCSLESGSSSYEHRRCHELITPCVRLCCGSTGIWRFPSLMCLDRVWEHHVHSEPGRPKYRRHRRCNATPVRPHFRLDSKANRLLVSSVRLCGLSLSSWSQHAVYCSSRLTDHGMRQQPRDL